MPQVVNQITIDITQIHKHDVPPHSRICQLRECKRRSNLIRVGIVSILHDIVLSLADGQLWCQGAGNFAEIDALIDTGSCGDG